MVVYRYWSIIPFGREFWPTDLYSGTKVVLLIFIIRVWLQSFIPASKLHPRFQEEMAIMKLLDHPNIVRLHEVVHQLLGVFFCGRTNGGMVWVSGWVAWPLQLIFHEVFLLSLKINGWSCKPSLKAFEFGKKTFVVCIPSWLAAVAVWWHDLNWWLVNLIIISPFWDHGFHRGGVGVGGYMARPSTMKETSTWCRLALTEQMESWWWIDGDNWCIHADCWWLGNKSESCHHIQFCWKRLCLSMLRTET